MPDTCDQCQRGRASACMRKCVLHVLTMVGNCCFQAPLPPEKLPVRCTDRWFGFLWWAVQEITMQKLLKQRTTTCICRHLMMSPVVPTPGPWEARWSMQAVCIVTLASRCACEIQVCKKNIETEPSFFFPGFGRSLLQGASEKPAARGT